MTGAGLGHFRSITSLLRCAEISAARSMTVSEVPLNVSSVGNVTVYRGGHSRKGPGGRINERAPWAVAREDRGFNPS